MTQINSMPKKSWVNSALRFFWDSFLSPLSLVTFWGPFIVLHLSFLYLKDNLKGATKFPELKILVQNSWTEPMADYNVQFIVLIIVFVFAVIEILSRFWRVIHEYPLKDVKAKILADNWALSFATTTVLFIVGGFVVLLLGTFSTPEDIDLFKSNAEYWAKEGWSIHPPPLKSNIFLARFIVIFIYSPVSNYLLKEKLPRVFPPTATSNVNK